MYYNPDEIKTYRDAVYLIWLPKALYIGIPEKVFWRLNPRKMKPYQTAYEMKQRYDDFVAWNTGRYVQMSIASCLAKEISYPERPYSYMKPETENNHDYAVDAMKFAVWAEVANREFEGKQQ